jgi:hypothetical protein
MMPPVAVRWLVGLGLLVVLATAARRRRLGGLQAGQSTHVRDGAAAIRPAYCAVTRTRLTTGAGSGRHGRLAASSGSARFSPLDKSPAVVWSLGRLTAIAAAASAGPTSRTLNNLNLVTLKHRALY